MYLTNKKCRGIKCPEMDKIRKTLTLLQTVVFSAVLTPILLLAAPAQADGFVCYSEAEQLQIQVYNHVNPEDGTRTPSVMILSDLSMEEGHRFIAKFSAENGELFADGARYFARTVAPSEPELESSSEDIILLGHSLGTLLELSLAIDFSYERPVAFGQEMLGVLEFVEQDGQVSWIDMMCTRYLRTGE